MAFARAHLERGDVLVSGGEDSPIGEGIVALPFFAGVCVVTAPVEGDTLDERQFGAEAGARLDRALASGHAGFATPEGLTALRRAGIHTGDARVVGVLRGEPVRRVR